MNRSKLAALSAGAMFLVASVLAPATTLAAAPNDFSISAAPSTVSVVAGGASVSDTISTAQLNATDPSFTVQLSVTGLPSGVTASFSSKQVAAGSSSTLTIGANAAAALGSSTITVSATNAVPASPSYTHTATFTLTVLGPPTGTVSLSPASVSTPAGSTFSVSVNSQASVAMSGVAAPIDFDTSKLQIVSVTQPAAGTGWNVTTPGHSTTYVLPSVAAIATANATGHLAAIAAYFTDGTSSLPASTNEVLATVTFFATATGTPTLSLTTSGSDVVSITDGTAATYGSPVAPTASGTAVTITAGTGSNNSVVATITGSVDSGYVSLTCPQSVTVPLVRNVVNQAPFQCVVGSNVTWTLSTQDNNPNSLHGHMVDATQTPTASLADSLHVLQDGNYNVDLQGAGLQTIATGQNNVNVALAFSQNVRPSDKPGSYSMSVLFSVTSTF